MMRLMGRTREREATRDVYGRVFAQAVLDRLSSRDGVELFIQHLSEDDESTSEDDGLTCGDGESTLPVSNVKSFKLEGASKMSVTQFYGTSASVLSKPEVSTLYLPQTCSFPVVDALHVAPDGNVTLFKVTVADKYQPSGKSVSKLFRELKGNGLKVHSFIWIVDGKSTLKTKQKQAVESDALCDLPPLCGEYDSIEHYRCRFDFAVEGEQLTALPTAL